jgi:hypothetical protein
MIQKTALERFYLIATFDQRQKAVTPRLFKIEMKFQNKNKLLRLGIINLIF